MKFDGLDTLATVSVNGAVKLQSENMHRAYSIDVTDVVNEGFDLAVAFKAPLYRNAARPLGVPEGDGLHQLRHTCVSLLIAQGVNIKAIQEWVGHSSIVETLDTYGHLFPDSMNELADKLDEYALLKATADFLKMAN